VQFTGEPGCGKTLLTRAVVQRLEASRYEIALVTNPHGGRIDLLRQVLYELGIEAADTARTELEHTLHDCIVGTARRGRETLVIVDDAQHADDPAWFEQLSSLLNIQTNERTLVTILLSGTPELIATLRRVQHLDRRVSIRCALDPLTEEQTVQYVRYRLGVAGGGSVAVHAAGARADPGRQSRCPPCDQRSLRQCHAAGPAGHPPHDRRRGHPPRPRLHPHRGRPLTAGQTGRVSG